jgi:hypothetical protein
MGTSRNGKSLDSGNRTTLYRHLRLGLGLSLCGRSNGASLGLGSLSL